MIAPRAARTPEWTAADCPPEVSCLSTRSIVIATGASPFVPPIPGRDLRGTFIYRTLDDPTFSRLSRVVAFVVFSAVLLAVASLTSVLRLWVQSRRHASDPPPAIDGPRARLPRGDQLLGLEAVEATAAGGDGKGEKR